MGTIQTEQADSNPLTRGGLENEYADTENKIGAGISHVIASDKTWLESEALEQLERTARLPGMSYAAGMPDLHPGKGHPVGAAFISRGIFYPYLIGGDIGCGMALWQTDLPGKKAKLEKLVKKLGPELEETWGEEADRIAWLKEYGLMPSAFDRSLGTIGGGNHFAELQLTEKIEDAEAFAALGLDKNKVLLLIHSGSRGLGASILNRHIEKYKAGALRAGSSEAFEYLAGHDYAIAWARANRGLIARRFLNALKVKGRECLDLTHNALNGIDYRGEKSFLHRKGAAPADQGAVVIPGSRGDWSYLVTPAGDGEINAFSLAHGAGRKWKRSECKGKLKKGYHKKELLRTSLGSGVICENLNLLYEEAPQAYKDIDQVIKDMRDAGILKVIAVLRPLVTFKTRKK